MFADLLFKIWNKGVDIIAGVAANTISAAIIALIATWTWRWKRKRDLKHEEDKQRQQDRVAKELAKERQTSQIARSRSLWLHFYGSGVIRPSGG